MYSLEDGTRQSSERIEALSPFIRKHYKMTYMHDAHTVHVAKTYFIFNLQMCKK